jgi:hypothetical protein
MSINKKELRRILLEVSQLGKKAEKVLESPTAFAAFADKCVKNKTTPKLLKDIVTIGEDTEEIVGNLELFKDPKDPKDPKKSEEKDTKDFLGFDIDALADFAGKAIAAAIQSKPQKGGAKKRIPAALRKQVWNQYVGAPKGEALCPVCKHNKIDKMGFEAGHVIPECTGGPTNLHNLRPICGDCNRSMGSMNMQEYAMRYYGHRI